MNIKLRLKLIKKVKATNTAQSFDSIKELNFQNIKSKMCLFEPAELWTMYNVPTYIFISLL